MGDLVSNSCGSLIAFVLLVFCRIGCLLINFFMSAESARLPSAQQNVPAEVRPAPQPRASGEDVRRGASPAALGALVNRVNNLLSGQASTALSVSLRILS